MIFCQLYKDRVLYLVLQKNIPTESTLICYEYIYEWKFQNAIKATAFKNHLSWLFTTPFVTLLRIGSWKSQNFQTVVWNSTAIITLKSILWTFFRNLRLKNHRKDWCRAFRNVFPSFWTWTFKTNINNFCSLICSFHYIKTFLALKPPLLIICTERIPPKYQFTIFCRSVHFGAFLTFFTDVCILLCEWLNRWAENCSGREYEYGDVL